MLSQSLLYHTELPGELDAASLLSKELSAAMHSILRWNAEHMRLVRTPIGSCSAASNLPESSARGTKHCECQTDGGGLHDMALAEGLSEREISTIKAVLLRYRRFEKRELEQQR